MGDPEGRDVMPLPRPRAWCDGENWRTGCGRGGGNAGYPRVDILRQTPAQIRFLSCEPLLEGISDINLNGIDWVIVGGESGHGSRPFDLAWARALQDRCARQRGAVTTPAMEPPVQGSPARRLAYRLQGHRQTQPSEFQIPRRCMTFPRHRCPKSACA